jgi:hypothetical protein
VDLADLTPKQAADLADRLGPMLGYLTRLTNRMQQRGWDANDTAYLAAWRARDELHELCVRLRYAGRGPGRAGNPAPPTGPTDRSPRPWEPGGGGREGA